MYLIYTFRTFPWIEELKEVFPDVFVFGKLNEDFEKFCNKATGLYKVTPCRTTRRHLEQKLVILGIALGRRSRWEGVAVNKFHGRKIMKGGVDQYMPYIPEWGENLFPINKEVDPRNLRTTFCNWTIYKIQDFLIKNKLEIKLSFVHLAKKDLQKFREQVRVHYLVNDI